MNTEDIERLVERFFEGETTLAEEKELYAFFAGDGVPPSLERYRSLFSYIEQDLPAKLSKTETAFVPVRNSRMRKVWLSVAASAAIILGVAFLYFHDGRDANPFEGSYIIRNGVRITDPKIVAPEIEASMRIIAEQSEKMQLIAELEEQMYEDRDYVRQAYDGVINSLADEYSQEAARKVLYGE